MDESEGEGAEQEWIGLGYGYVNVNMWNLEYTQNTRSQTLSNAVMLRSYVHKP